MGKQRKPTRSSAAARAAAKGLRKWRTSLLGRLAADGASNPQHIARRTLWLSQEWKLPPCPKVGRTMSDALLRYCDAHSVSLDWLLYGDLKGLQRMVRNRNGKPSVPTAKERMLSKYYALAPEDRRIIDELAAKILAERGAKEPEPA